MIDVVHDVEWERCHMQKKYQAAGAQKAATLVKVVLSRVLKTVL